MAVTRIHSIKSTVSRALQYITDGAKTRNCDLVDSFACSTEPEEAGKQFREITAGGTGRNTILAHHIIQSFAPDEISPEDAMLAGQELCRRFLKNQYQYVIATHEDHDHIHNHIIFNNTNLYTGRTFETEEDQGGKNVRAWKRLMNISDDICRELGLSVIEAPEKGIGASHYEWEMQKSKQSWKEQLRHDLDRLISQSDSFDDFLNRCRIQGIEAVYKPENKVSLKFRTKGQQKFTRARTLGWCYLPENIMRQIELQNQYKAELERIRAEKESRKLSSFIGISRIIDTSAEKMQNSPALEHWADIQNMKNASKIINILTELNIQSVRQLNGGMLAQHMLMGSMLSPMDEISRKIKELDEIIHLTEHYHEIKPEYKKYKAMTGFWKRRYEKKNPEKIEDFHRTLQRLREYHKDETPRPTIETLKERKEQLIQVYNEKLQAYYGEKKKFNQMEYCRSELEKYFSNERKVQQQRKRKRNDLE